jgi:hypothetical protein
MIRTLSNFILRRAAERAADNAEALRLDALTDHGFLDRAVAPNAQSYHIDHLAPLEASTVLVSSTKNVIPPKAI